MSWTHSSKVLALGVLLAVAIGTAGTAAAVSFADDGVPDEAQQGENVTWSVTLEEPYDGIPSDEWTLLAKTDLADADITLTARDVSGNTVDQTSIEEDQAEILVSQTDTYENDVVDVVIEVSGTVPEIEEFDYENKENEEFNALELFRLENGDEITLADGDATWSVHRFTEDSKNARQAIDSAQEDVDESGNGQDRLDEAITFYNSGEFERAVTAAEDAENTADDDGGAPIFLIAGAAVALVLVIGGGAYVYTSRQQDTSKLQ